MDIWEPTPSSSPLESCAPSTLVSGKLQFSWTSLFENHACSAPMSSTSPVCHLKHRSFKKWSQIPSALTLSITELPRRTQSRASRNESAHFHFGPTETNRNAVARPWDRKLHLAKSHFRRFWDSQKVSVRNATSKVRPRHNSGFHPLPLSLH